MFSKIFSLFSRFGTLLLAGYIAWLGWGQLGPHKPEIGSLRKSAADEAASAIVEELRTNRGDISSVVLLHFEGDTTDYFTNQLRAVLEQRGVLDLHDRSLPEKVRDLLNLRQVAVASPESAIEMADNRNAGGVVFGRLTKFESTPSGTILDVEYSLVDVKSGDTIHSGRFSNSPSISDVFSETVSSNLGFGWIQRWFGWAIIVLLLPVFTIGFIRMIVAKHSNRANAFLLLVYTLAGFIFAHLITGASFSGFFSAVLLIGAGSVCFIYNLQIMNFALKMEE